MNNYQKAKEEGIKSFWQSDVSKYCDVTFYREFEDQLSSFAEKIKEGCRKDMSWWKPCECTDREACEYHDLQMAQMIRSGFKPSDSQTIKE